MSTAGQIYYKELLAISFPDSEILKPNASEPETVKPPPVDSCRCEHCYSTYVNGVFTVGSNTVETHCRCAKCNGIVEPPPVKFVEVVGPEQADPEPPAGDWVESDPTYQKSKRILIALHELMEVVFEDSIVTPEYLQFEDTIGQLANDIEQLVRANPRK